MRMAVQYLPSREGKALATSLCSLLGCSSALRTAFKTCLLLSFIVSPC